MKLPCMTTPCKECPFRKDSLKGWLGGNRAKDISDADSFVCHKTLGGKEKDRRQCAGHMLVMREGNSFYNLAKKVNLLPELIGEELVFENETQFIKHHVHNF